MPDLVSHLLALSLSVFLVAAFFLYRGRDDEFFVRISLLYMLIFFQIPMLMVIWSDGFFYGRHLISSDHPGFERAVLSMAVFVFGYFANDCLRLLRGRGEGRHLQGAERAAEFIISKKAVFAIVGLGIAVFFVHLVIAPDSTELYNVRRGRGEPDHASFFLSILSSGLMLSAFFLCLRAGWRTLAGVCIGLLLAGHLAGSPGRITLAITLALIAIFVLRPSIRWTTYAIPPVVILLAPIILNGKVLIYEFIVNGVIFNPADLYDINELDLEQVFVNLAHPFASIVVSDNLISIVGYRLFYDYVQGFLFYLRVFGWDFGESLTYFNTEAVMGIRESIIPPGYIAFGFAQASYFGVLVAGVLYRMTFALLRATKLYRIALGPELAFYGAFLCANTFYTGDMRQIVLTFLFPLLVMHLCGQFVSRRRVRLS